METDKDMKLVLRGSLCGEKCDIIAAELSWDAVLDEKLA
jgi:hypothetical protein